MSVSEGIHRVEGGLSSSYGGDEVADQAGFPSTAQLYGFQQER
jgi:hypothetical protein